MPEKKNAVFFQEHYDRLNAEQKKAVDTVDGALLVLAGPGTGKTQLLSVRAANILRKGKASPENILMLTFSNAAASAMRERLANIIGHDGYSVEIETFHSFANSIVLETESAFKYVRDKIDMTEVERVRALEYIIDNVPGVSPLRPFGAPYIHRREMQKRISELKNEGILPCDFSEILKNVRPDGISLEEKHIPRLQALALIYEKYEKLKDEDCTVLFDERGRIDYDDMILIALSAFRKEKGLRDHFRQQYKYIMVDEFQDTNAVQLELLFSMLPRERPNLCCVGDDDQSIYRFQGAALSNFRDLRERVSFLKTVKLRNNYRSTGEIINLAGKIIKELPEDERISAKKLKSCRDIRNKDIRFIEFRTEEEELAFVTDRIKKQAEIIKKDVSLSMEEREKPYNNIAVLVRKRSQILKVIDAFLRAGIPYATDGKEDIRPEKRVRQMLDVLELARVDVEDNNKKSLTLYKILSADYNEISHADILRIIGFVNGKKLSARGKDVKEYLSYSLFREFQEMFPVRMEKMPAKKESGALKASRQLKLKDPYALHKAAWIINRLIEDARNRPVHDLLMQYIEDAGLYRYILKRYENDKVLCVRDLRSLVSFVNMVKNSNLANPALGLDEFMDELNLREIHAMPLEGEVATLSQDGVRLYTAHASKGMEFHTVFLPFCLEKKSWPLGKQGDAIPLPPDIFKNRECVGDKDVLKKLNRYDEVRLFYVASTRSKAYLIYTSTPQEKVITSSFLNRAGIELEQGSPPDEKDFLGEFIKKTKRRDPFEDSEEILKDIVSTLALNPTSLNNYIECSRKFLYDNVLMLPGKKNQHLVFGNCAHKALEEIYAVFMEKKDFPGFGEFKKAFKKELEYQGVNKEIKAWCSDRLETLKEWYRRESELPVQPVELENKLEIFLKEGLRFRGTFDKIEREGENTVRVIDYKTGKPDKHVKAIANCEDLSVYGCDGYYRQLISYKLLYDRAFPAGEKGVVTKGVLQFLEPVGVTVKKYGLEKGEYRNIAVELTDEKVKELEKVILKCWRDIRALKFDKLPERDDKERCARCAYDSICWGS